ncbi:MAG: portal protein [Alcanivorax sp.]
MAQFTPHEIMKRAEKADARKDQWRSIYEECYEFALPQRNLYSGFYDGKSPGQDKMARVFDATAINSTQRFANRIQSALFPPYRNWCRLQNGNEVPEDRVEEIGQALDLYTDRMFDVIRQTNFDLAMSEFLLDLCVGTAVMLIQPGDDDAPVRFTAVPQYLVSLEEGPYGVRSS